MRLNEIEVQHYRNYDGLTLDFPKTLNIFLGENAQGKTNLLESIYVLAMTRSHRTSNEKELVHWDSDSARISGVIEKRQERCRLRSLFLTKAARQKSIILNRSV